MEEHRSKIKKQLEDLRAEYRKTLDPIKRKIITARGKALKYALEKKTKDIVEQAQELFKQ